MFIIWKNNDFNYNLKILVIFIIFYKMNKLIFDENKYEDMFLCLF